MDCYTGLLVTWALSLLTGVCEAFNIDTKRPKIIRGSKDAFFGYTVQQHEVGGKKWLVVGAPFEMNGQQRTGDIFKCSVGNETTSDCVKLNIGRVTLSNVSERKDNMRLGLSLTTNPKDNSFVACSPLWSHECGSTYYTTGMCSRVNSNFRFSKTVAPALQKSWTPNPALQATSKVPFTKPVDSFYLAITLWVANIEADHPTVGVLQYGEEVVHEFHLNDFRSVKEVVEAAKNIEQRGGTETRTALGIETARSEAFQKGGRKGAKKVMIVITDGESHDSPDLDKVIENCEKENITRYAVAVLGYYNRRGINPEAFLNEIKLIASDPDDKYFFNVTDEAALKDIVDALGEHIFSLEGGTNKNETSFGLEMSQAGFSSHVVEDGILLGAVGAYDWTGAVLKETSSGKIVPKRESYLREFPEELKNHGAYLGYTVTSAVTRKHARVYVAGAPRFNHTGKVIIFTMHNNENLTIHQSLKAEQIGSYYGSEIDSVDVNGDGITDVLLVGAPMYFSEGRERGKVYVYILREIRFAYEGYLRDLPSSQNSRFGSSIASVPDLNQDSFNDVVVGAPLEDDHQGAIYIYHGYRTTVLKRYKQRIPASNLAPGLKYFGWSVHGELDLNSDGLVDLAVGSLGNAVLLWSRSVVQVNASITFEPAKINIFNKDCRRNGKEVTCMAALICFMPIFRSPHFRSHSLGLQYNATIDERRYTPRAVLDENSDKHTQKVVSATAGRGHCDRLHFHVLDTADYVKPITFNLEYELVDPDAGPILEDGWPTSLRVSVPFWNGCNEEEHCVPDLVMDAKNDIPTAMEYCRTVMRRSTSDCATYTASFDTSVFIIESTRRRIAIEATLENKGENAYNTVLNITYSRNLQFASLIQKEDTDIKIDCMNGGKLPYAKICNISFPFFRSKARAAFRLDFEFSKTLFKPTAELYLAANSDSLEKESTRHDNTILMELPLKYQADLLFTRHSSLDRCEIKSKSCMEQTDSITKPFNCTFKIQNLGFFPVEELAIKITIPVATRGGNRLLMLTDFLVDQENITCNIWGNNTEYQRYPTEEDLSSHQQLNYSNADVVSIDCNVNLASNEEVTFLLHGRLWLKSLKALKFRTLKLVVNAALQRKFHSPFIFQEDEPSRQVIFDLSKHEDFEIPIWIIIGSTLGGLLLLALLVLALWKLGFFKSTRRKQDEEQEENAKVQE
ncbi:integrin alpha-11 [Lissotriton helveticus]